MNFFKKGVFGDNGKCVVRKGGDLKSVKKFNFFLMRKANPGTKEKRGRNGK